MLSDGSVLLPVGNSEPDDLPAQLVDPETAGPGLPELLRQALEALMTPAPTWIDQIRLIGPVRGGRAARLVAGPGGESILEVNEDQLPVSRAEVRPFLDRLVGIVRADGVPWRWYLEHGRAPLDQDQLTWSMLENRVGLAGRESAPDLVPEPLARQPEIVTAAAELAAYPVAARELADLLSRYAASSTWRAADGAGLRPPAGLVEFQRQRGLPGSGHLTYATRDLMIAELAAASADGYGVIAAAWDLFELPNLRCLDHIRLVREVPGAQRARVVRQGLPDTDRLEVEASVLPRDPGQVAAFVELLRGCAELLRR